MDYQGEITREEFTCEDMTATGCERMDTAKNLKMDAIAYEELNEPFCTKMCCADCDDKLCGYRCGKAFDPRRQAFK